MDVDAEVTAEGGTCWKVTAENCVTGLVETNHFDAVIVCNG